VEPDAETIQKTIDLLMQSGYSEILANQIVNGEITPEEAQMAREAEEAAAREAEEAAAREAEEAAAREAEEAAAREVEPEISKEA